MKVKRVNIVFLYVVLIVTLVVSVNGSVWNGHCCRASPVSCEAPKVILQSGNASTSTIYTNDTSAKVSAVAGTENIEDYVDNNTSNEDSSNPDDKGTHSNFAAQQAGPDSTYDTLTEENTATTSTPIQNMNFTSDLSSWTTDNALWENVGSPLSGAGSVRYRVSGGWQSGTAYCQQDFTVSSIPSSAILTWYWKKSYYRNVQTCTIWVELIHDATTKYSWTDTQIGDIGWTWQSVDVTSNIDSTGTWTLKLRWSLQTGSSGSSWIQANFDDVGIKLTGPTNYELDLEVQWTSADHDETNEELCIRTGTFSGSEDLQVKVRSGSSWVWVMNLTASQWNNVSITSYLTGTTFTIQFLGGTESSDITQDGWDIDATLLHVWATETYDHVLKVVNQDEAAWKVNLKVYSDSSISRISSLNISLHDGTTSNQIAVSGGSIVKSEGAPYDLPGGSGSTVYISISNLHATTSGTSYLYTYLKIREPTTSTTYNLFVITFEIT